MKYHEVVPISRQDAALAFSSGSPRDITHSLIRVVYHDPDWRWAQELCIEYAKHPDSSVAGLAVTCFGHLARIHGELDLERVLPILEELKQDEEIAGRVEEALDDISIYMPGTTI